MFTELHKIFSESVFASCCVGHKSICSISGCSVTKNNNKKKAFKGEFFAKVLRKAPSESLTCSQCDWLQWGGLHAFLIQILYVSQIVWKKTRLRVCGRSFIYDLNIQNIRVMTFDLSYVFIGKFRHSCCLQIDTNFSQQRLANFHSPILLSVCYFSKCLKYAWDLPYGV